MNSLKLIGNICIGQQKYTLLRVVQGVLWHGSRTEKVDHHGSRKQKFCFPKSRKYNIGKYRPANSQFSRESPSFSSDLLVSQLEYQISRELPTVALFKFFFINFVIFKISKRKIKQEGNLLLLFELLSIGKHKTEQSNWYNLYLMSILQCNWSEIKQSNCSIHGAKLTQFWYSVYISQSKDG